MKRRQHEEHHHQEDHDHASTVERLTGQNDGGSQKSRDEEQVGGENAGGSGAATDAVLHAEWDDRGHEDEQGQVRRRGHEGESKDQRESGQSDCDERTLADEQAQGDGSKAATVTPSQYPTFARSAKERAGGHSVVPAYTQP